MVEKKLIGIVSPPYQDAIIGGKSGIEWQKEWGKPSESRQPSQNIEYGKSKQNIGNLPDKKLVGIVSPPYSNRLRAENRKYTTEAQKFLIRAQNFGKEEELHYSNDPQNIGNMMDNLSVNQDFDIIQFHQCNASLEWHGCYDVDSSFKKYITPESYAHPAKMGWGLCDRIFKHMKELGLLNKGDVVADFMAGSGRTGIMSSLHGHDFVGVELEPHFIKMINDNKANMENQIGRRVNWEIIQGDSRKLSELIKVTGQNTVGILSPPYSDQNQSDKGGFVHKDDCDCHWCKKNANNFGKVTATKYSSNPSNIGNLKDSKLIGITSPPFENSGTELGGVGDTIGLRQQIHNSKKRIHAYGQSPEQIGNEQSENYLSAMLKVYQEAFKCGISPLILVTKNPTRKGQLRRLDLDTIKILQLAGYEIFDYHQAVLFHERKQQTLIGTEKKTIKGRISFFKRLSVQKGNKASNHEDVIFARIPA